MASLFSQLSGFEFPDVLMNSGPLPSTVGGPAGSDGSVDGVINGTSALLQNISPYALGKSARTGSDRNYQQIPHRFQYIIPKLFLPSFHHGTNKCIQVSHAVDQGDIAFLLYGGERAWFTSKEQFRSKAPPCAFAGIEVVNYILLCIQASKHSHWELITEDLLKHDKFQKALERRRKQAAAQPFDDLYIFQAVRMLVQQFFVPHGICAGSEHQGGQHEHDGGQPVQAAVNFVTTMTVDGKNVDLVNYWYRHNMLAGDELIFRLERQTISKPKTFTLSTYYKQPVSETVHPDTGVRNDPEYWQLVPDILRSKAPLEAHSEWCDHRSEGYWRVAQTFQTRGENNSANAFTRGLPIEVTFAPVWHSFSDCSSVYGKAVTCAVDQYNASEEIMAHINPESMIWLYKGDEVFTMRKVEGGYLITHDPEKCLLMVNNTTLLRKQLEITMKQVNQIHFMCFDGATRDSFVQKIDIMTAPTLAKMETYAGSTNDDIDHIDMKGTDAQRTTVNNAVDFYVRMVLETTENGGFLYKFCQLLPEKYMLRHGVWIEDDKKYKRLKSLQITYTNDEREKPGNRPDVSYHKSARTTAFTKVKEDRIKKRLDPIIQAVFPTGEALVPHVEMPLLALDAAAQTGEPLLARDADVCPTAQAFGLSAQVDAAGPRKKKTKVLRFLSANETDQTSNVSDVSTADSGH
jgi:hypothetical protein